MAGCSLNLPQDLMSLEYYRDGFYGCPIVRQPVAIECHQAVLAQFSYSFSRSVDDSSLVNSQDYIAGLSPKPLDFFDRSVAANGAPVISPTWGAISTMVTTSRQIQFALKFVF